jgi:hypothetical protein
VAAACPSEGADPGTSARACLAEGDDLGAADGHSSVGGGSRAGASHVSASTSASTHPNPHPNGPFAQPAGKPFTPTSASAAAAPGYQAASLVHHTSSSEGHRFIHTQSVDAHVHAFSSLNDGPSLEEALQVDA